MIYDIDIENILFRFDNLLRDLWGVYELYLGCEVNHPFAISLKKQSKGRCVASIDNYIYYIKFTIDLIYATDFESLNRMFNKEDKTKVQDKIYEYNSICEDIVDLLKLKIEE